MNGRPCILDRAKVLNSVLLEIDSGVIWMMWYWRRFMALKVMKWVITYVNICLFSQAISLFTFHNLRHQPWSPNPWTMADSKYCNDGEWEEIMNIMQSKKMSSAQMHVVVFFRIYLFYMDWHVLKVCKLWCNTFYYICSFGWFVLMLSMKIYSFGGLFMFLINLNLIEKWQKQMMLTLHMC